MANPCTPTKSMLNKTNWRFMLVAPFDVSSTCCYYLKKSLGHNYSKQTGCMPITATMASESVARTQKWLENGCNSFDLENPISNPMSFWTEQDVLQYIYTNHIEIAPAYGEVIKVGGSDGKYGQLGLFDLELPTFETTKAHRTGCFPCGFGMHLEKVSRLQTMIDNGDGNLVDWMLRGGAFTPEDGLWRPKGGLGMYFVLKWMNVHGNLKIFLPDEDKYYKALPEEAKRML